MATSAQHHTKWMHNRRFLGAIPDDFPDWMVVAMFYAAVHAVETLLAHDRVRIPGSHTARNQTLKTVNRYQAIWRHYRPLFDAARAARYEVETVAWIPAGDVKNRLVQHLYGVEAGVLRLTGAPDKLPAVWPSHPD